MVTETSHAPANRALFEQADVVDFYDDDDRGLFEVEAHVFSRHVAPGCRVLDLGVGAGRTTSWLLARARKYVALDYSEHMVDRARERHPGAEIVVGDAADLSRWPDESFDVVVFSFNGIDCLDGDGRQGCLRECSRVLTDSGRLILSRHNARCVVEWPKPVRGAPWKIAAVRAARHVRSSAALLARRARSGALRRGHGTELDPHHGGMQLAVATPEAATKELAAAGFDVIDGPLGNRWPVPFSAWRTPWFYLIATRQPR
jgi:SAM-dependent methyltransferase